MHENTDNLIQIELKPREPRALNARAYRHGLTGQVLIMTPEDQAAYHQHCQNIKKALAPEGAFETGLAQSIADDRWRLFRAASLDINTCAVLHLQSPIKSSRSIPKPRPPFAQAVAWAADSKNMNLLSLYEGRIQRRVERNSEDAQGVPGGASSRPQASRRRGRPPRPGRSNARRNVRYRARIPRPSALPPQFDISLPEIARLATHQARRRYGARKLVQTPRKRFRMAAWNRFFASKTLPGL